MEVGVVKVLGIQVEKLGLFLVEKAGYETPNRPKAMPIPKEQKVPAICRPPCLWKLLVVGNRKFPLLYIVDICVSKPVS